MQRNGSETSSTTGASPAETLTSAASRTCGPMISEDTPRLTSSPALVDGQSLLDLPDGPTIDPSGPAPVRVSRFRAQDSERAIMKTITNDTTRVPDESVTAVTMRKIRDEIIEECAACIPTTWLDPILTGSERVGEFKNAAEVQRLLTALAKRIRALKGGATR
jgi:hypothetical protein